MAKQMIAAVFGCGRIGKMHVENLLNEDLIIKTIYDIKIDHLTDWAKEYNLNLTSDENDIWNDPEINAIFIFSSTNMHLKIMLKAVGKVEYIFCEKPVSIDIQEALNNWNALKKFDYKIQMGFNRRFDPNFKLLKSKIEDNQIGQLNVLKITSRDPEPPSLDYIKVSGGIFMDMVIHDFDMLRYISGKEVSEIFVMGDCLVDPKIKETNDIDTAIIQVKFADNTLGAIDISRKSIYGYDQRIEAFGLNGMIKVNNESLNTLEVQKEQGLVKDNPPYFFIERYLQAYKNEYKDFIQSFKKNKPVKCTLSDGIKAQLIAEAAKQSWNKNQPIKVKQL